MNLNVDRVCVKLPQGTHAMQYLIRGIKVVKVFNLLCDRCGGQNNNRMVLLMLSYVLNNYDVDSITLIFLVSGHS